MTGREPPNNLLYIGNPYNMSTDYDYVYVWTVHGITLNVVYGMPKTQNVQVKSCPMILPLLKEMSDVTDVTVIPFYHFYLFSCVIMEALNNWVTNAVW